MAKVIPGRFTAQTDEPFVVFMIGMRINKFFAFHKWIPTVRAMGPMLSTLYQHPEKGFLGAQLFFNVRGPMLIQYWCSFDDLEKFARDKTEPHLSAWKRFSKSIGSDGSVGIWHETYLVDVGKYEAVYGNMPISGLAAATTHIPAIVPPSRQKRTWSSSKLAINVLLFIARELRKQRSFQHTPGKEEKAW